MHGNRRAAASYLGRDAEARLVHDLREDRLIALGVVQRIDEGKVIGYVAFSPVAVEG